VISAIVPTFGGRERIARNLPSVLVSLAACGEASEMLIVNDGGGDLGALPDGVRLILLPVTQGYGPAVNGGVNAARGDVLLILNDDIRLEEPTVRVLRESLPVSDVFAVVPTTRSPLAQCGDEGGKAALLRAGLIEIAESPSSQAHFSFYPVGCCYVCQKKDYLDLGGYDDSYAPFYWEDVDLGYRAWRRGLATIHEPKAICHHEGSATIGAFLMDERQQAWFRNWTLFHLRNLQDSKLRAASFGALAALALFDDRDAVRQGLSEALARYAHVGRSTAVGRSDAEILAGVCVR
jgi:GT2 family glycosyltransferase